MTEQEKAAELQPLRDELKQLKDVTQEIAILHTEIGQLHEAIHETNMNLSRMNFFSEKYMANTHIRNSLHNALEKAETKVRALKAGLQQAGLSQ